MELETINLVKWLLEDEFNKSISNISYDNGEGGYYILEVEVEKTYCYDESEIYTFLIDSETGKPNNLNYNGDFLRWNVERIVFKRLRDEGNDTEYSLFTILPHSVSYEDLQDDDLCKPVGGIVGRNAETYCVFPEIRFRFDFSVDNNLIGHRYLIIYESCSEEYLSMMEEYGWEKGTYEYEMMVKKRYGLFDLRQNKVVIQPAFDEVYEEGGKIYTVLRLNGIFKRTEEYVPKVQKGAGLVVSSIHSEDMYNCYHCPIIVNTNEDLDENGDYIFRVGEYAGYTIREVYEKSSKILLDMVKNSILHVEFYQDEDTDNDNIDEILLLLSSWSDCHMTFKDIIDVEDTMQMSNDVQFHYSTFRFEGWNIGDVIKRDHTYLLRLVKYRKIYINSNVFSDLKSKYSYSSRMLSMINEIEVEMILYTRELEYEERQTMEKYADEIDPYTMMISGTGRLLMESQTHIGI